MLKGILSIAGRPGLFKLINPGKNMLIVESLQTGKRSPAYAHDKVISLADISMYTLGDDVPLSQVLESLKKVAEGKPVDVKGFKNDAEIREFFAKVLPEFDDERVYTNDIKKLINWYNLLLAAGIDTYVDEEEATKAEAPEA